MRKSQYFCILAFALIVGLFMSACISPNNGNVLADIQLVKNVSISSIGDSIVYGYTPNDEHNPLAENFSAQLSTQMNTEVNNYGISGLTTTTMLSNLNAGGELTTQELLKIKQSDIIIMCIGANDLLGPALDYFATSLWSASEAGIRNALATAMTNFKARYEAVIDWFTANRVTSDIYLMNIYNPYKGITSLPIFDINMQEVTKDFLQGNGSDITGMNQHIANIVNGDDYPSLKLHLVDIYTAFDNYTGTDDLVFVNTQITDLKRDLDPHPTATGHTLIKSTLWQQIKADLMRNLTPLEITCEEANQTLVTRYSLANLYSNAESDARISWYSQDVKIDDETLNSLVFNPSVAGNYNIYAMVNGIKSNTIQLKFLNGNVTVERTQPDASKNNVCTISFTYNVTSIPQASRDAATDVMKAKIMSIFEHSNYLNFTRYILDRQTDNEIKYYALQSGAHEVSFADGIVRVTMPNIIVTPLATLSSPQTVYTLGEFDDITLTFNFSGGATENKRWLSKSPNRSVMEYLPQEPDSNLSSFTFVPDAGAGVYQFAVQYKFNGVIYTSQICGITVEPKPYNPAIEPIITKENRVNSKNKINAFEFTVTNLDNVDPKKISWRVNGIQQAIGTKFVFEPDFVDTYVVYAVIDNIDSNHITVTASISNTPQKIVIILGAVGVLTLMLILSIVVSIKKEKIW